MPLANESQQLKLEDETVLHCALDTDGYICVFNNLMSNHTCGNKFQSQVAPRFFKSTYVFKNGKILSTIKLLQLKGCINLMWVRIFGTTLRGFKDLRANTFKEGEFDVEDNPKSSSYVD